LGALVNEKLVKTKLFLIFISVTITLNVLNVIKIG